MDLFKFVNGVTPTTFTEGQAINGYDRLTWVERYSAPGEFKIETTLSSGLSIQLPVGCMISHADTLEVMIVENHEIEETIDEDPKLTISGRTFWSYFENRIVGMLDARAENDWHPYILAADYTWNQLVKLINDHIQNPPADVNDALTNIKANTSVTGVSVSEARTLKHDDLFKHVSDILKIDDLGIKTIRRNEFGVTGGSNTETKIHIYKGANKTSTIMFSSVSGDISQAHYLISQKKNKNCALVLGDHFHIMVDGPETKYDRRMMLVDGKDIDKDLSLTLPAIISAMTIRGKQALASQNMVSISQIDLSDNARPQFRRDYNIGDLVSIDGSYGSIDIRRISEYAEIEDENGTSGHPTLSDPLA